MSTRSCIARKTGVDGFSGVYHHWDGYPEGLGATLFKLYRGHFARDLPAMLTYLIDDHPAGWSTINGRNFTPSVDSAGQYCYCHGARSEAAQQITNENASDYGCEFAYVFDQSTMFVLASMDIDGNSKMVGMFGIGTPSNSVYWKTIGIVDLDGAEPDWDSMLDAITREST